jgi:hypothetical protein
MAGRPRNNPGQLANDFTPVTVGVDFTGPFFTRDPKLTVRGNIRKMLDALSAEMERDVKNQMETRAASMPGWTGWSRDHVVGRTHSLGGKRWGLTAVVSANTNGMDRTDAIRTKAAAATIERRWHPFRRTAGRARRARAVITANLTAGLE